MHGGSTITNMFQTEESAKPLRVINANVKHSACNLILVQHSYFAGQEKKKKNTTMSLISYAQPDHVFSALIYNRKWMCELGDEGEWNEPCESLSLVWVSSA